MNVCSTNLIFYFHLNTPQLAAGMKTPPLTVVTIETPPLTVVTIETSPLTVVTMETSPLTVVTIKTSPVTIVKITDLYPNHFCTVDGIKTCKPLCL